MDFPYLAISIFKQVCIKLDWLHLADHGVTAAFAGSITLWHMLLGFYMAQHAERQAQKFALTRFRHKPPVLKAQAATLRKMVPWLAQLLRHPDYQPEEHRLVMTAMMALGECCKMPLAHPPT